MRLSIPGANGLLAAIAITLGLALAGAVVAQPAADDPWDQGAAKVDAAMQAFSSGGVDAVSSHLTELHELLAEAPKPFDKAQDWNGALYYLADSNDDLASFTAARRALWTANGTTARPILRARNPYPSASFILGYYYNEIGRPQDALTALAAGLAVAPKDPRLISETGAAHAALHQWPESLATYSAGIGIDGLAPADRARLFRGEGFALTELRRYDEAEQAYRTSLELAPGNAVALNELTYIAGVKAGAAPTDTHLITPGAATSGK